MDHMKTDAPAFEYPVWEHVPYHKTMNNFRGGFDYQHIENLEHAYILSRIQVSLPNSLDTQMADTSSPQPTRPTRITLQRPATNNNTNGNNAINNNNIPI